MAGKSDAELISRREFARRAGAAAAVAAAAPAVLDACSAGGQAIRGTLINAVENPRAAHRLDGWITTPSEGGLQLVRVTGDGVGRGDTCVELRLPRGAHRGGLSPGGAPTDAGRVVWCSAAAKAIGAWRQAVLELRVAHLDGAGRLVADRLLARAEGSNGEWAELRGFDVAPDGAASARPVVLLAVESARTSSVRATNVSLVHDPPGVPDYFDGDYPGCSWRGARHASPSVGPPPRPKAPARDDLLLGFNDNAALTTTGVTSAGDVGLHDEIGSRLLRVSVDLRGPAFGPRRGARIDWSHPYAATYDALYSTCREAGIEFLPIPLFCPPWMGVPERAPPHRRYAGDWAAIAAQLAERWPEAVGIEVWNEPNLGNAFWFPSANAEAFAELLAATYEAIKRERPSMAVLTGGLSGVLRAARPADIAIGEYLSRIYAAGAGDSFDGLSYHAYPERPATGGRVDEVTRVVREVMASTGDRKPLWLTEIGTSTGTAGTRFAEPVTEGQQALVNRLLYGILKQEPDMRAIAFHTLISPSLVPQASFEAGFEFVERTTLRRKPVFHALREELAGEPARA